MKNVLVCEATVVASNSTPQIEEEVETPVSAVKVVAVGAIGAPEEVAVPEMVTVETL